MGVGVGVGVGSEGESVMMSKIYGKKEGGLRACDVGSVVFVLVLVLGYRASSMCGVYVFDFDLGWAGCFQRFDDTREERLENFNPRDSL